jgi:hypothetical protein
LVFKIGGSKVLVIQYKDDHERGQFSEFEVDHTNYSYLLDSLEAHTGTRVDRTSNGRR